MNNLNVFEIERSLKTSKKKEMFDLTEAWLSTILIVAIAILAQNNFIFSIGLWQLILVSIIIIGTTFVIHEIVVDVSARFLGCDETEFKKSSRWFFIFGFLLSFLGLIVLMPGITTIKNANKKKSTLIMFIGISTNVLLAVLFLISSILMQGKISSYLMLGFSINVSLAVFSILFVCIYWFKQNCCF